MKRRLECALTAARWLGTKEESREHKEILKIYNSIRPLPRGYSMRESDPWCAAFVSAAAVQSGVGERYPLECSCGRIIEKAKEMDIWVERDDHIPSVGDWVLYNWDAKPTGDDTGAPDHVGVVIGMEDGDILVVEGNYDNAVKLRRVSIDWSKLRGFVHPELVEVEMRYHTLEQVPGYARSTIEKLVADGSLRGIAEDDLGLSEELIRILVILDRRGRL